MANFDEIKQKVAETANTVVDKSADFAKNAVEKAKILGRIAKLTAEVAQSKDAVRKEFVKIGEAYVANFKENPAPEMVDAVDALKAAEAELEAKSAELEELKTALSAPAAKEDDPAEPEEERTVIDVEESDLTPAEEKVEEVVETVTEAAEEVKEAVAEAVEEIKEEISGE